MICYPNSYEKEIIMNQTITQNINNEELQIYHSALCLIEAEVFSHPKDNDFLRKLNTISKKINTNFPELDDKNKEDLLNLINEQTTIMVLDKKNKKPQSNLTYKTTFLQKIRDKRKQYDEAYIRSILSTDLKEDTNALNQVKNFINSIKTQDPYYYDNIVRSILKNFRKIAKSQTEIHANRYEATPELLEYVENARQCINLILDDYKIEHIKQKEKPYALRYIDRALFNGCLNKINTPTPPSTFETMSANAQDSIAILKEHQQEGHCYHNSDNAEILITCLEYHMLENNLENKPFPVLVNSFINARNPNQNSLYFYKHNHHTNEYTSNMSIVGYYCRAIEKIRNYPKPRHLRHGIKHQKEQKIYEQDNLIENICLNAKQVLINLCEENNISPDIIHIAFGLYTSDSKGNFDQSGYKYIYNWLTQSNMKNSQGYETNSKGEHYGPIFVTSRHHDREQINFSTSANTAENNIILTLPINTKASVKLILNNIINRIESKLKIKEKSEALLNGLAIERQNINKLDTNEKRVDVHRDILHGVNIELSVNGDEDINYYYLTPKKPSEKTTAKSSKRKTKNQPQDEHIIAIVDARTPIYDISGNQPSSVTDRTRAGIQYVNALINMKNKKIKD